MSYLPLSMSSTIVNIPKELAERIMLLADNESLYALAEVSPVFYNILSSDSFQKRRLELWFSDYAPDQEDRLREFVKQITAREGVEKGSEEFISHEDLLQRALQAGRRDIVALYMRPSDKDFLRKEARAIYDETLEFINRE